MHEKYECALYVCICISYMRQFLQEYTHTYIYMYAYIYISYIYLVASRYQRQGHRLRVHLLMHARVNVCV